MPILLGIGAPVAVRYAERPPPAHTGGFGEPTCARCHFDGPENDSLGAVALLGVPESYRPGEVYPLTVVLRRSGVGRGGFQLAAREAEAGSQAGTLRPLDERVALTAEKGVDFAHHARAEEPAAPDTVRWTVQWTAPSTPGVRVLFHLVGNAANGDDSELGDYIYTATAHSARDTGEKR